MGGGERRLRSSPSGWGADDGKKAVRFNGACALPLALFMPPSRHRHRQKQWWSMATPEPCFPALAHLATLSSRYLAALRLTHSHSHCRSHPDSVCDSYFNYFLCDFRFCYSYLCFYFHFHSHSMSVVIVVVLLVFFRVSRFALWDYESAVWYGLKC